jgi:hypothetical protein
MAINGTDFIIFTFLLIRNSFVMKLTTRILSLLVLAGMIIFASGCGPDPGKKKGAEEQQFEKLASSWTLVSASDGDDRTADFVDLVLTLSGTFAEGGTFNYDFTGVRPNPSPWPKSGTWKFGDDVTSDIIRDPGTDSELALEYTLTSDTNLTINFVIPDGDPGFPGGSRVGNVTGAWTFEFVRQ